MKRRSAFVVPAIAAVVAAAIVAFVGPFQSPTTRAASSLAFEAKFETAGDFFDRFDYGLSGVAQSDSSVQGGMVNFHGDHDSSCGAPTTLRDVHLNGTGPNTDFSQMVWYCAPGGDPTKGHIMTGLNTFGYNHLWFSPKQTFTSITKVCWDINETEESSRKWTELQFVGDADAHRYPTGSVVDSGVWARGTGGFDLGYTDIGFRGGTNSGPTTGLVPQGGDLAGLKIVSNIYSYFENQDQGVADQVGWPGNLGSNNIDKATRYKHCLSNNADGQHMTITDTLVTGEARTMTMNGQIPQDSRRVVFHDSTYDAPKADNYNADFLTWHWDNIQVFTDSDQPTTTTAPTTEPPTTMPPTTEPPTTMPPTTEPPTTMPPTTEPPTTMPPTTEPPTTMPPTTEPPTTMPPTTEPPTTMPPTTEPPTTMPPTTEPPTTMPPTTEPPTTMPPTTEPPTTMPPTTMPPTTESTTPPSTSAPDAPVVTITSGPEGTTTDPNATIAFEVIDGKSSERAPLALTDGATVTCSLDGAPAETCTSPVHYQDLSLGEHKVVVTATDGANDQGSATHVWSVVAVSGSTTTPTTTPAPPSVTSALQHGVLPLTGSQSTRLAIVGLMMIMAGLLLGSVFAIGRRLHP